MRINEILTESQLQQLDEGPIGSALGAVGRGIGKVAGGLAKGVGAVAGGVVGAGRAMKKGYQSGKAFVGDDPDPNKGQPGYDGSAAGGAPAAPAGGAPAAPAGGAPTAPAGGAPTAQDINAAGPAGTAPAKAQTGAAGAALAKTDAVTDKQTATKAGETVYAQVKSNVDKLDKKGKQRILQLLQKSMAAPEPKPAAGAAAAAGGAPAAAPRDPSTSAVSTAAGDANPFGFNEKTGKPFTDQAERDAYYAGSGKADPRIARAAAATAPAAGAAPANTMANAPVSATNTAAADNPNQPPPKKTGGKVAGQVSQTPGAIAKREKRQAAASAKSTGNKVFGQMANTLQQQNASKNNYGNALSEALALRVEAHKQKMFETGLSQGTISVFRK